jgi:hypothetical protein
MPADALEILRSVNDNLRSALVRLRPERRHCSTLKSQDFSELLGQLIQAAECLRNIPSHCSAAATTLEKDPIEKEVIEKDVLEKEALEYRSNLEKLKHFLPDLHVRLLAERTRLETARSHVAAASTWARVSKETF